MYQKILVPLDGSDFSEAALEHVKAIAMGCKVPEVILLMVVEPYHQVYISEDYWPTMTDDAIAAQAKAQSSAKDYVSRLAKRLKKERLPVQTAIVSGSPDSEILDYANKNQVDLIIMSTHGRSGISRWVFGSVTDRVIRNSAIPVLVASPPGRVADGSLS
ncbi:universal stress protein [Chloroflexota bacterium]